MKKLQSNPTIIDVAHLENKIISLENRLLHVESLCFALQRNRANVLFHKFKRARDWFFYGSKAWLTFTPGCRPRRILKKMLVVCRNYALCKPWLKSVLLSHSTQLEHVLRRINLALMQSQDIVEITSQSYPKELSPRAQVIYTLLQHSLPQKGRI